MQSVVNKSIEEYAPAFEQGDEKAFSFFYKEFYPALTLYAYRWIKDRSIAEEIASNAFVKIWKFHWKLNTYAAIRAYLYKIVRNECQDILRVKRKRIEPLKDDLTSLITDNTPFDNLVRSEVYRIIHSALKELSSGSRKVLTMHYLEGKTTGEIASELHVSASTVKTQKARGLENLRKILLRPTLLLSTLLVKVFLPFL